MSSLVPPWLPSLVVVEAKVALNPLVLVVVLLPNRHRGRPHLHPRLQVVSFTPLLGFILAFLLFPCFSLPYVTAPANTYSHPHSSSSTVAIAPTTAPSATPSGNSTGNTLGASCYLSSRSTEQLLAARRDSKREIHKRRLVRRRT